jgi:DNA-binding phage protein
MWNSVIRIPRRNLPDGFNLNPPPDEVLSYAESQSPAEPVKLSQKQLYVNQLKENFKPRMSTATVSQAVKFLLSEGMTADEVIAATGISEATLYRSLRLSVETSPTPEAVSAVS